MARPLFNWLNQRSAGVLLHPTSLPGPMGIGNAGKEARLFVDWLAGAGITWWQVCPLGPTGYGDSPYQCFSAFAGNPYLIDLEDLASHGLILDSELAPLFRLPWDGVDFGALYQAFWPIMARAAERFFSQPNPGLPGEPTYAEFAAEHSAWLEPYVLFMGLKSFHQGSCWWEWEKPFQHYQTARTVVVPAEAELTARVHRLAQYAFFRHWSAFKAHANTKGVKILGDLPIFTAMDSADVWANPELFQLNAKGKPKAVAGVPPDYFSATGQLWGNPLYDWPVHAAQDYSWWFERLRVNATLCDALRLDHFRGFSAYWSIPANAPDARKGKWVKGPGIEFFKQLAKKQPGLRIVAEDLGEIDEPVRELLEESGLPGMKVLQFAFGGDAANPYLPHHHTANAVIYPGTHDNDTSLGWYKTANEKARDHARRYLRVSGEDIGWDFVRACYTSPCRLAIIPLADLLSLGSEARLNTPGQASGNWQWRCTREQLRGLRGPTTAYLRDLAVLTGREPEAPKATETKV